MTFPETWEEYEKQYGFIDTEEVYTNGSRLIQSFRVKQWLEHIEASEDNEPTWEQVKDYCFKRNYAIVGREMPKAYLRGFSEVNLPTVGTPLEKPRKGADE